MTNITIQERKDIKDKNKRFRYSFHYKGERYRGGGFPTKAIARMKAREHLEQLEQRLIVEDILFEDEFYKWLDNPNKVQVSEKQHAWYRRSLKLFTEFFGEDAKLNKITRDDYYKFLSWYGNGKTVGTVKKVHSTVSQVFRHAHNNGRILINPTVDIVLSNFSTKPTTTDADKFLNDEDYLKLIDYLRGKKERSYLLLYILAITGARFSEGNKLTERDLLANNQIHLRGTKNVTSDRIVAISEKDMNYIKERLKDIPKKRDGMLFDISHNASLKSFRKALKDIGVKEDRTPHSLRHTHCSYLLHKDIPIEIVSKRLGHKSVTTTREIYSHILKGFEDENAKKIRDLFS